MIWTAVGACSALIAVALGAFGAHGLRGVFAPDRMTVFETAARYQLVHAVALVALGLGAERLSRGAVRGVGTLLVLGTILFSGSLYAFTLTGIPAWGAVTPFGGLAFLAGWAWLAWAAWRAASRKRT